MVRLVRICLLARLATYARLKKAAHCAAFFLTDRLLSRSQNAQLTVRYQSEVIAANQNQENGDRKRDSNRQRIHHALRVPLVPIHEKQSAKEADNNQKQQNYNQYFHQVVPILQHR